MKIQRNLHPAGRVNNIGFGLCAIADGFVRVFSFGFLHTTLTLDHARNASLKAILKKKEVKP
jgi:hypothetical protein